MAKPLHPCSPIDSVFNSGSVSTLRLVDDIQASESIMVNVRRGDFVNSGFHGTMGASYFEVAVSKIRETRGLIPAFVFSDDMEWSVANLSIPNSVFVGHEFAGPRFIHYFQLMRLCTHFVIPNSTFAWWAAFLGQSDQSIVYRPRRWFLDDSVDTKDLFPSNWTAGM